MEINKVAYYANFPKCAPVHGVFDLGAAEHIARLSFYQVQLLRGYVFIKLARCTVKY
jgi:hypothetical protein